MCLCVGLVNDTFVRLHVNTYVLNWIIIIINIIIINHVTSHDLLPLATLRLLSSAVSFALELISCHVHPSECCRPVVLCSIIDGQNFLQPHLVLYTTGSLIHTHTIYIYIYIYIYMYIHTHTHTCIILSKSYFNLRQPILHSVLLISRDDSSETEQKSPKEKMLQNLDYCMAEKWSFRVLF
jgi:hypothetical protein